MKSFPKLGAMVAVGALALALPLAGSAAAVADEPIVVSIRAALDLPSHSDGAIVYEVTNVTAGEGPELTEANLVSNPSDWCGSVDVDVDPVSKSIFIYTNPESQVCNFETVSVTITSAQIGTITLADDTLFDESLCPDDEGGEGGEGGEGEGGEGGDEIPATGEFTNGGFAAAVDNGTWTFDYTSEAGVVQLDWSMNSITVEGETFTESAETCGMTVLTFATVAPAALAATGAESPLLGIGVGAGALLLGAAAVAAATVGRRSAHN